MPLHVSKRGSKAPFDSFHPPLAPEKHSDKAVRHRRLGHLLSRLHSVALCFPGFGGVSQENRATPPQRALLQCSTYLVALCFPALKGCHTRIVLHPLKGPCYSVAPIFSALKAGVALQFASWKVSLCKGVSQLHCHLYCREKKFGASLSLHIYIYIYICVCVCVCVSSVSRQ